jgi:penicillin amidase
VFQEHVLREVLFEHLSESGLDVYMQTAGSGDSVLMGNLSPLWVDQDLQVERALETTCANLISSLGEDSSTWSWGALHPLSLTHPFSSSLSLLKGWDMPVVPWVGSGATVAAASYSWGVGPRKVSGMQSMRFIMPFDDLGSAWLTYPGGQSGQPGSRFYRSHFQAFADAQPLPLWFNEDDIAREALFHLSLTPAAE